MVKVLKKTRALLFLFCFFVGSFQPVQADTAFPHCSETLTLLDTSLGGAETTLNYSVTPTGLQDDSNGFYVVYSGDGSQSDLFFQHDAAFTGTFTINIDQIRTAPQSVYLQNNEVHYCEATLIYDARQDRVLIGTPGEGEPPSSFDLCQQAGDARSTCDLCLEQSKIWTGVGCVPYSTATQTVRTFILMGLGVTGMVVVLMTLYAGFLLSTSQGDPKRVDEAKSAITSAIVGAFFIIFSVTILRFIGVEVLRLPSFG